MGDTYLDMAADSSVPVLSGTHSNVMSDMGCEGWPMKFMVGQKPEKSR